MLGADPAGGFQATAKRPPGTMKADCCVGRGYVKILGHCGDGFIAQIYSPNHLGIILLELRQHPINARADRSFDFTERGYFLRIDDTGILFISLPARLFGRSRTVVINDGISEDPIEPGYDTAAASYGMFMFNGTKQTLLEKVLRNRLIAESLPQEPSEGRLVFENARKHIVHDVFFGRALSWFDLFHNGFLAWKCDLSEMSIPASSAQCPIKSREGRGNAT